LGGLSKKAYQFNNITSANDQPFLVVDGGSLLFKSYTIAESQLSQAKTTAMGIVRAYNLIGYNAVGISSRDLAGGLDFLKDVSNDSQFSWVSANLISKKDKKPLFTPYLSLKVGTLTIGITGITDQLPARSTKLGQNYKIAEWQEMLPSVIEKLAPSNDFIILLTSLDDKECREIAKTFPSVKMIIQAKSFSASREPYKIGSDTVLTRTGKQGKYAGVMNIKWHKGSTWENPQRNSIISARKAERNRLNKQLARFKSRPEHSLKSSNIRKRLDKIEAEITELERNYSTVPGMKPAVSSYRNWFLPMEKTMPDHHAVLEVVHEINRELATLAKKNPYKIMAGNPTGSGFMGWRKCRECHLEQTDSWQKTRHASSYLTLVEEKQNLNLDCLPCHITGFPKTAPPTALYFQEDLQAVGCEVCHGSGATHVVSPKENRPQTVAEKICLNCHTPERDNDFVFARDILKTHSMNK